jgi:peptidase inhibitor family I36
MHLRLQTALASIAIVALGLASSAAQQTTTTTTTTTTTSTMEPARGQIAKGQIAKGQSAKGQLARAKKAGHCVTSLEKPGNPTACYDTFTAAIAAATGGQVADAPGQLRVAMKDKGLLARLNATGDKKSTAADQSIARAEAPVLIIYCDDNFRPCTFGNSSHIWTGRPCTTETTDVDRAISYVGDDWNDDFESFQAFNNCWAKVFQDINFGGASLDFAPERPDFGSLNDEISSIQLS